MEIALPWKHLRNRWETLEILLVNCEINLVRIWSLTCVIANSRGAGKFSITDAKCYVPAVTLSTEYNPKPSQELKSCFKQLTAIN